MLFSLVMHAILVTVLTGLINIHMRTTNTMPKSKSLTFGGEEAIIY